jgi:CRISP-associated protein Cas1
MRRQLNTLYATTDGAWLHKDGANIVMEVEKEIRARLPVHMLEGLVCIGRIAVSPCRRVAAIAGLLC